MKRLLTFITALFLLVSLNGQIMRYNNYVAPPEEGTNDFLTNLAAYWAFEEGSGTLDDSQGSNNSTGCTADYGSTGINGNCLSFTAANEDHVTFADAAALQMYDQDFTMVAWINLTDYAASGVHRTVIGGENGSGGMSCYSGNGRLTLNKVNTVPTSSTLYPSTGEWVMIAISFNSNSATNNILYYMNSTVQTGTYNANMTDGAGSIYIGRYASSPTDYFNGLIDEVMIWKGRILTEEELDEIYGGGTAPLFFADFE